MLTRSPRHELRIAIKFHIFLSDLKVFYFFFFLNIFLITNYNIKYKRLTRELSNVFYLINRGIPQGSNLGPIDVGVLKQNIVLNHQRYFNVFHDFFLI